jgi:hypothetical protein
MRTGPARPSVGRRVVARLAFGVALLATSALLNAAPLKLVGSGGLGNASSGQATGGPEVAPSPLADNPVTISASGPALGGSSVTTHVPSGVLRGNGLNHHDQRTADNGNQFSLEPPDQGLCVGNGFVIEAVNNAIRVRSASTNKPITGVTALNRFFGFPSEIDRTNIVYGPFLSDPKCVYDVDTKRFFVTELVLATDPATGGFTGPSFVVIAVSKGSDPTKANGFTVFLLDTTDNGTNGISHPDCPCLGDQPLIGLDQYGFYISTNEFPLFANGFNGTQIYGISKRKLAAAASGQTVSIPVAAINVGGIPTPDAGGIWYSVQPASYAPNDDDQEYDADSHSLHGVEYFLSALEFFGIGDTRIAAWALTNTASLESASPALSLQYKVVSTEFYIGPPSMTQKGDPGLVQSNDDRMNQVKKYHNALYAGLNTAITAPNGSQTAGVAYFGVHPSWKGHKLDAHLLLQGYVTINNNNVAFPSIALNGEGKGIMAFSIMGPDYYPSAAYIRFTSHSGAQGPIVVTGPGVAPYPDTASFPSPRRWGDYSACSDENNHLWAAAEMIPIDTFGAPANGGLANWGTEVWRVTPDD